MKRIKYLVLDVDGTLTDGKIYMSDEGELIKTFNIKDGYGIRNIAIPNGIIPVIITGRSSKILENRCRELNIEMCYQGIDNKIEILSNLSDELDTVSYIGDDLNDLECMRVVKNAGGIIGCPADAVKEIVDMADFVSTKNGGNGAVREFIDWIINL